jgi:hypothetical protein
MDVGTLICPVQQDLQESNVVWMGLSSHSTNFNKDVMFKLDMEQFPVFMRLTIHSPNFHEESTTLNNGKSVKKPSPNDFVTQWTSLMTVSTHQPH